MMDSPLSGLAPVGSARIGLVSLGCSKALVDSERILTRLRAEGYEIAPTYDGADLVIVNTCGFLDSARAESLEAIGEALAENGKVVVTGCMGVDEATIRTHYPDVLAVTGPHQYEHVLAAVHAHLPPPHDPRFSLVPPEGLHLTPRHYAYLKVAEGCNHRCSFCIIPQIRGPLSSRSLSDIAGEAERLVQAGVKELLVISQDTGAYGLDLPKGSPLLPDLARTLGDLGIWIRLHYVYPYPALDTTILPLMAEGKILPYLDVPFQHAHPRVLKAMRRPADHERLLERIHQWRTLCPELTLRSTFIVGFPGETEDEFNMLLDWLEDAQIDRAGCFKYEDVKGAPANAFADPVDEDEKEDRYVRFMEVSRQIADERSQSKIGKTLEVLIDDVGGDGALGRSWADSPEVDGSVTIEDGHGLKEGDLVRVTITEAQDHDLWGHLAR